MTKFTVLVLLISCFFASPLWAYTPQPCAQLFDDVPNGNAFCPWIEDLWRAEITVGCANGPLRYCPDAPLTRAQAAELLGKALHQHLWGEGRPNARVYGHVVTIFELLCDGAVPGVFLGLSRMIVTWEGTPTACPAGYWVCTAEERGNSSCDTIRPDDAGNCDGVLCGNTCFDFFGDHEGWLADQAVGSVGAGEVRTESGIPFASSTCTRLPVWCCTR